MQLWRTLAQHNIPLQLSLDDVHPALCHLFIAPGLTVPAEPASEPQAPHQQAAPKEAELAAAALELAAALASHSVRQECELFPVLAHLAT